MLLFILIFKCADSVTVIGKENGIVEVSSNSGRSTFVHVALMSLDETLIRLPSAYGLKSKATNQGKGEPRNPERHRFRQDISRETSTDVVHVVSFRSYGACSVLQKLLKGLSIIYKFKRRISCGMLC